MIENGRVTNLLLNIMTIKCPLLLQICVSSLLLQICVSLKLYNLFKKRFFIYNSQRMKYIIRSLITKADPHVSPCAPGHFRILKFMYSIP